MTSRDLEYSRTQIGQETRRMKASDRHIIASRPRFGAGSWSATPDAAMTIAQARSAYDAGAVEMAQAVTDEDVLLYAIPRRRKEQRRPWFGRLVDVPAPRALGLR